MLQYREWLTGIGQPLVDELEEFFSRTQRSFRRLLNSNGKFKLDSPQWDDLRMPAIGINPPGAATDPTLDQADGRWIFSASATNMLALQAQLPHAWVEGTSIEPHVHWSPTDTNTGNVLWRLEYKIASVFGAFPSAWTTIDALGAANGVSDQHLIADFVGIDTTGHTLSCILLIKLSRIGGDASDTYAGTAKLNYFDIHFRQNSLGSNAEYVK